MAGTNDATRAGTAPAAGYYLVGEFLSAYDGDAYEDKQGHTRIPLNVKVLVNDESVTVRYNDGARGRAMLNGAERGALVQLRIFPRVVKMQNGSSFVKIEGWVPRSA